MQLFLLLASNLQNRMHILLPTLYLIFIFNTNNLVLADPPYEHCPDANDNNSIASNNPFQTNVGSLLLSLSLNASVSKFYNMSVGNGNTTAYGLYLCYDYVTLENCKKTITMATQAFTRLCRNSTDATIWEEQSMLRVSNKRFFSQLDMTGNINKYNTLIVSEAEKFRSVVNTSLYELALNAAFNSSAHMYATQSVAFSAAQHIYSLVQCTMDLSPIDCHRCLQTAIVEVLGSENYRYRGGRLLSKSCYLRYEFYQFYEGKSSKFSESQGKCSFLD